MLPVRYIGIGLIAAALSSVAPIALYAEQSKALPLVSVTQPTLTELNATAHLIGSIAPVAEIHISPSISGHAVLELLVDIGDHVTQGQPLARIDNRVLTSQFNQAQAQLHQSLAVHEQAKAEEISLAFQISQAEQALARTKALADQGAASQATLEQALTAEASARATQARVHASLHSALAAIKQAEAGVAIAERNLSEANVIAPHSGIISARNASVGQFINSASPMFTLIKDGELEMYARATEKDLLNIKVGLDAKIIVAGSLSVDGSVIAVAPSLDANTRMAPVKLKLKQPDRRIAAGMFATALITTDSIVAIAVPDTAILHANGRKTVMTVGSDGVLTAVDVITGLSSNGLTQVISGLTPDDTIVTKAASFFLSGDAISPLNADEAGRKTK